MQKKELELKKRLVLDATYNDLTAYNITHDLITKVNSLTIQGTFDYHDSIKTLDVRAKVTVDFDAVDARDGNPIKNAVETIIWEDQYVFFETVDHISPDVNVVLGDEFDEVHYALDQIVLNIPMNFSKNYDRISFVNEFGCFYEEDEYESLQENKEDSRWEKLKDFKFQDEQ